MLTRYLVYSLLAATPILALSPRVAKQGLLDITPKGSSARLSDTRGNATLAFAAAVDGLSLFPRQSTCAAGSYACPNGGGCCDNDENCTDNGCCDKPKVQCGEDSCYNPSNSTCCADRGTSCPTGYDCMDDWGCCEKGKQSCGEDACYNPDERVCCPEDGTTCPLDYVCRQHGCCREGMFECGSGKCYDPRTQECCTAASGDRDSAWSCGVGESCCAASGSCYDPDTEICCAVGACDKVGSCCDHECCDADERCGLDGFCTATAPSTARPTATVGVPDQATTTILVSVTTTGAAVREMLGVWQAGVPVAALLWRFV